MLDGSNGCKMSSFLSIKLFLGCDICEPGIFWCSFIFSLSLKQCLRPLGYCTPLNLVYFLPLLNSNRPQEPKVVGSIPVTVIILSWVPLICWLSAQSEPKFSLIYRSSVRIELGLHQQNTLRSFGPNSIRQQNVKKLSRDQLLSMQISLPRWVKTIRVGIFILREQLPQSLFYVIEGTNRPLRQETNHSSELTIKQSCIKIKSLLLAKNSMPLVGLNSFEKVLKGTNLFLLLNFNPPKFK